MTRKKLGLVITACATIVMSIASFGSVKDDLTALEQEAGVETDENASISSRLSALEEELSITVEDNASTSDRIKVLQKELGLEAVEDETEAAELTEPEQAVLVAYQKIKEELLNPHSLEVYECYAKKARDGYYVRIDYSATNKMGGRNEKQGYFKVMSHDDKRESYVQMEFAGVLNGLSAQFEEYEKQYNSCSAEEISVDPERVAAHEDDTVYIVFD